MIQGACPQKFTMYGKTHRISFSVSKGTCWLNVNDTQGDRKSIFSCSLSPAEITALRSYTAMLLNKEKPVAPGTKLPIAKRKYNEKQWTILHVIRVENDDRGMYVLSVDNNQEVFTVPFSSPGSVSVSHADQDQKDRNVLGLKMFQDWLTLDLPIAINITNEPYRPPGGGGGNNRNAAPAAAPASQSAGASGWDSGDQGDDGLGF